MTHTNNGGPAFPQGSLDSQNGHAPITAAAHCGISMRDYFAAKAMQALIARGSERKDPYADIADHAGRFADAMLAERAK